MRSRIWIGPHPNFSEKAWGMTVASMMSGASPASVPRIAPAPLRLTDLDDDTLTIALARAPFATHAALRAACRRARELVDSAAFADERVARGLAEHGFVVAGGSRGLTTRSRSCFAWPMEPRPIHQLFDPFVAPGPRRPDHPECEVLDSR